MIRAYSPSHITGFFEIFPSKNPLRMGSRGCGIVLEKGCITEVEISDDFCIKINGIEEDAPTTAYVVSEMAKRPVTIFSEFRVPVGGGFGASGAGALSTAYALNELFSLNMTVNELAGIAHRAEVSASTGLGDVLAQTYGGIVIRKEGGAPGIGVVDRIPCGNIEVGWVYFGKKSTKGILTDEKMVKRINSAGRKAMKDLMKKPSISNFMKLSARFARETELMSERAGDAMEAVESFGGVASVAMIGDAVFAIGGLEALSEFGEVERSGISFEGARLL
ncbi:MAG: pantoate kinase [Candidatus Syntropharchaeia archaeon]